MRAQAIMTAWYSVAMEYGAKDMTPLEDILSDKPPEDVSKEEYYRTLRRLGLR